MNSRLADKVALITGGGSWIGKEIAKVFAMEKANVCILGRDAKKLVQTTEEITATGGIATAIPADISQERSIQSAVNQLFNQYGQIDIVVQNAGIYSSCFIEKMSIAEWMKVMTVNLTGSFIVLKSVLEIMKQQCFGKIIFISSIAGEKIGLPGFAHYTASKAGINGLMRTAAIELAEYNINVNSIEPGNILNQDIFKTTPAEMNEMLRTIPLSRLGKPLDVAKLALFLASDDSNFITGQTFVVDGGETISA